MILRGVPLEIGNEVACLADNIERAVASGRIEDLGHPAAENPLIKSPVGVTALWFACQGEHCQQIAEMEGGEALIGTVCSFGVSSRIGSGGEIVEGEFSFPDSYASVITSGSPDLNHKPLCANRR